MQLQDRERLGVLGVGHLVPPMTMPPRILEDQAEIRSRIFAMVDFLDAMTSERPYHSSVLPFARAVKGLERGAGTQFDSEIVQIALTKPDSSWLIQGLVGIAI